MCQIKAFLPRVAALSSITGLLFLASPVGSQSSVSETTYTSGVKNAVAMDRVRYLKSLEDLVNIESGSRDLEGLAKAAAWVAQRLQAAGMSVETMPMKAPADHILLKGAAVGSAVYGRLQGTGTKKILLIAHMDTVYPKGMLAKQPFRVDGNLAYGLAIADDKAGVALIIHTVELLQKMGFKNYAEIGVLINADEEIGSPGSGPLITKLGGEYDAVFSYEGGGGQKDWVRLATSSIAIATLNVTGKASHAGAAPEAGRNALYEMAHQVLKSKDFGDKSKGLTINWTVAKSGETRNVIPAEASAIADIRASANADLDQMEAALQASVRERLIPDTKVELGFLRSRPAFVANDVSRTLAKHAVSVFREINLPLEIRDLPTGGGTDAAFAGLKPKGGVLESFGLRGHGAHSNDDEYIYIDSIEPRLYLSTRMVIDVGSGLVRW
jgi:glutamate carboxypeptidase